MTGAIRPSVFNPQPVSTFVNCVCNVKITPVPVAARPRRRSTAARLLRSSVRIPPGAWMSVCCECCVLSGRGPCEQLINRGFESHRGHGCLSVVSVVCCQVEVLASS